MKKAVLLVGILLMGAFVGLTAQSDIFDVGASISYHHFESQPDFKKNFGEGYDAGDLRLGFHFGYRLGISKAVSLGAETGFSFFAVPAEVVSFITADIPLVATLNLNAGSIEKPIAIQPFGGIMINTYRQENTVLETEYQEARFGSYVGAKLVLRSVFAEVGYVIPFQPEDDMPEHVRISFGFQASGASSDQEWKLVGKGEKTEVILPIEVYYELLEDLEDLAVVAQRKGEESIPFDDAIKELGLQDHV